MFPNSHHKPHKLAYLAIDSFVAEIAASLNQKNNLLTHMVVVCLECFEASLKWRDNNQQCYLIALRYTVHDRWNLAKQNM